PHVRVVAIGPAVRDLLANPDNEDWANYSIEFCGGTHLQRTGQAESFAITSEEAVAKGVRRLTALTGDLARQAHQAGNHALAQLNGLLDACEMDYRTLSQAVADLSNTLSDTALPAAINA